VEIEAHDARLQGLLRRTQELLEALREQACAGPQGSIDLISLQLPQPEEDTAPQLRRAQA